MSSPPEAEAPLRLKPDVVIGPAEQEGGDEVHYVKDRSSGRYFRVRAREAFLLGLLDGTHTRADVAARYAERFGRTLDDPAWRQLLELLRTRGLLEGTTATAAPARSRLSRRGLELRLHLADPDALLTTWAPRLGFTFHPLFVAAVLALVAAEELWVLARLDAIAAAARSATGSALALALFTGWLGLAAHELAHGLAAKRYGASVHDVGVVLRFLVPFPYCRLDDLVLFPSRRARVVTALAGPFLNLLLLLPFGPLWAFAPAGSGAAAVAAGMLTFFNAATFLNLLPFLRLDGYLALAHGLGRPKLQEDAIEVLRGGVGRIFGRPERGPSPGPRWVLAAYGCVSVLLMAATTLGALLAIGRWLAG